MGTDSLEGREVYVELHRIGQIVKATAMDTQTLTEVVTQGPVSAGEKALKEAAIRRLEYVLRKKGILT